MLGTQPAGGVRLKINDLNPANDSIVDGVSPATGWYYGVYANVGGALLCQGVIFAVDYTAPTTVAPVTHDTLTCDDISSVLNVPGTWGALTANTDGAYYTGRPTFTDNCGGLVQLKVTDRIDYTDCAADRIMATITRRFQAIDQYGNDTTVTQYIKFRRPLVTNLAIFDDGVRAAKRTLAGVAVFSTNTAPGATPAHNDYLAGASTAATPNMIVFNHCASATSSSIVPSGTADQKREKLREKR
jgi:hypothetical protein